MDEEIEEDEEDSTAFWDQFSHDGGGGLGGDGNGNPGRVPLIGGLGGIMALMGQPIVNIPGGIALGARVDDGDDDMAEGADADDDEYDEDDDDGGWTPPVAGAYGWEPVPLSLEDILGVDGFANYDEDELDATDAEDWAVEEDGGLVRGPGVDFPWGGGPEDGFDGGMDDGFDENG